MTVHMFVIVSPSMNWDSIFMLLHLLIFAASAADTLLPGQSIWDGYSLVSANGTFELGFFSPGNSSNSYLGIWYHNISEQTVVWVANRDWPLGDTSNKLTLTRDGNLMIVDGRGASFVFTYGTAATNKTTATMLDTGNLVVRDDNGQIRWQSFDNPTDNFLPGMLVGMVDGQNRLLTSWRSSNDPGTGDFSFGANPNGTKQFLTWQHGRNVYSHMTLGNEQILSDPQFPLNCRFVWGEGGYYMTLSVSYRVSHSNEFIPTRMSISHTGQLSALTWIAPQWLMFFSEPINCNIFNICGSFSVCSDSSLPPSCECLSGFQPADSTEWGNGVRRGGCVRKESLQCQRGGEPDGFLLISNALFPINGINSSDRGADKCRSACLNNCACIAYAFPDVCRFWDGDIATLQQLVDGGNKDEGEFYLRLAASEIQDPSTVVFTRNKIIVLATVLSVSISCISIGSLLCWRRHKVNQSARAKWSQDQAILLLGAEIARSLGETNKSGPEFTLFDFPCIAEATNSFSTENKLGQGGFGAVYKGMLAEGQEIAVKRLSTYSGQGIEEFKNEILLIAKLQHRNLVRLLGCCIQRDEKILIYEYMPNKSLDFFLFGYQQTLYYNYFLYQNFQLRCTDPNIFDSFQTKKMEHN